MCMAATKCHRGIAAVDRIVCVVHSFVPPSLPNNTSRYTSSQYTVVFMKHVDVYYEGGRTTFQRGSTTDDDGARRTDLNGR